MQDTILLTAISSLDFLNCREKIRLYLGLKKIEGERKTDAILFLQEAAFGQIERLSGRPRERPVRIKAWKPFALVRAARSAAEICQRLKIKISIYGGADYPPLLREMPDPPFALFYRGDIRCLFNRTVSVVGTRRLTTDGKVAARSFSRAAAKDGLCVVSGLAIGADGQAHQGAIDAFFEKEAASCATAAVLAGGVDNVFPSGHKKMAAQIIQNGGVILSECPPGIPAEKWRFVQRNRIIAGLSPATVVVQAPPGSGSMITAEFALDYGRELFFHQACFSPAAQTISDLVFKSLQGQKGRAAEKKMMKSPRAFADDGAQIVRDYEDFKAAMSVPPA